MKSISDENVVLHVNNLSVAYGAVIAASDVSIRLLSGEIVALVGMNGAGKSSVLGAIAGLTRPIAGSILFNGEDITALTTHRRVEKGVCLLPEGGGIFRELTVDENLSIAAVRCSRRKEMELRSQVYELFSDELFKDGRRRLRQTAGTLSGGERQQLAIARALMMEPTILMLDEPSLGLAPIPKEKLYEAIKRINTQNGTTILLVEESHDLVFEIAKRAYVMSVGKVVEEGLVRIICESPAFKGACLG